MKIVLLLLLFSTSISLGQDGFENFEGIKSHGIIPNDFLSSSSSKYYEVLEKKRDQNIDKEFFLNTHFFVDKLLLSGNVVFGDPISVYCKDVARYLLRDNMHLYNELRFYTVKSNVTNAFATDQGIIFVTTGLIARLENEAQLAYILAHEISHYTHKHVKEGYIEQQKSKRSKGRYRKMSYDNALATLSLYNQNQELEADSTGFRLFDESAYSHSAIHETFDILLRSHIPFEDEKIPVDFLNTSCLTIPTSYLSGEIREITIDEEEYDEFGTHPSIRSRRENLQGAIDTLNNSKKNFIVSESTFYETRRIARFQSVNNNLKQRKYVEAIYDIYLLKNSEGSNRFLDLSLVKALYGLTVYANSGKRFEVMTRTYDSEGEIFSLHNLFNQLSAQQISVIAFRHAYDLYLDYGDTVFLEYEEALREQLLNKSGLKLSMLKTTSQNEYCATSDSIMLSEYQDTLKNIETSGLSEARKKLIQEEFLQQMRDADTMRHDANFHLFGLHDLKEKNYFLNPLAGLRPRDTLNVLQESAKVILVDPKYENYKISKKPDLLETEDVKEKLTDFYKADYPKLDLDKVLLDTKDLEPKDVVKFNEIALINDWFYEVMDHELELIPSSKDQIKKIQTKYGTSNFLFTGIYSYFGSNKFSTDQLILFSTLYFTPAILIDLVFAHNFFEFVAFNINAETHEVELIQLRHVNIKGSAKSLQPFIYEMLLNASVKL